MNKWRAYERLIASLTAEEYDSTYTIIPNARINGLISKRKRQIDVLVEYRYDSDLDKRIIFDAKDRKRPIDIKEVESFEGLMKDVGSKTGFIICSNGYSKAAKRRAQENIGIRIISSADIDELDLSVVDKCMSSKCYNGLVFWDIPQGIFLGGKVTQHQVGKCDECGWFHIWCWGCGNKKVLTHEDEWNCLCQNSWFWLTAIEEDIDQSNLLKGVYLLIVMDNGEHAIIDRRPL